MPRTSANVGLGDERCLASRHVGLEPVRLEDLDVLLMAGDGGSLGISMRGGSELRGISMRESREFCLDRLSQRTVCCTISTAAMYCRPGESARTGFLLVSTAGFSSGMALQKKFTQNANGRACTTSPTILMFLMFLLFLMCVPVRWSCKLADETVHAIMAEDKFSVCGQIEKNGQL